MSTEGKHKEAHKGKKTEERVEAYKRKTCNVDVDQRINTGNEKDVTKTRNSQKQKVKGFSLSIFKI